MAGGVRILTDVAADLPQDAIARYRIGVVPISVSLNGRTHMDDGMLDRGWFYGELARVPAAPSTAAPSPQDFSRAYSQLALDGAEAIVVVTVAAAMSSLHEHAVLAARKFAGAPVHVVDGMQVSMGLGWLAISAAELAEAGASAGEVVEHVRSLRARTRVVGVVDSIDYLRRSGRVGWIASAVADLLELKPLICFSQGHARRLGRVRTFRRGVEAVVANVRHAASPARVAVIHSGVDPSLLLRLQAELARDASGDPPPVIAVGPAFASHVGPGCVGAAVVAAP